MTGLCRTCSHILISLLPLVLFLPSFSVGNHTEQKQVRLVGFFLSTNFEGPAEIENYGPGCHDLSSYFSATTESLNTGGNCIRVFSEVSCTGDKREFSGAHSKLEDWINKVKSWEGCSSSTEAINGNATKAARVAFFWQKNLNGWRYIEPFSTNCHELPPDFSANTESLNTGGKCVKVFAESGCTGHNKNIFSVSNDLADWSNKIISWKGCTANVIPEYISRESRVSFFTKKDFQGQEFRTHYTPGCHELPAGFTRNTQSLNSHNKCVRVYSEEDCSGEYKDYFPGSPSHNDLRKWNDKIRSWEGCITPNETVAEEVDGQFRLFEKINFEGLEYIANYTQGCHDLPSNISAHTGSINTHDKCVRVFSIDGCTGDTRDYFPGSTYPHHDLKAWKDKIKSWETCPTTTDPAVTTKRIEFYFNKNFYGRQYVGKYEEACQELPRNFRGDTQSLKTGGNCIRVFALGKCSGNRTEFTGAIGDLGSWNDKIRSWESCSFSTNRTSNLDNRVTFFVKTSFKGWEVTENYSSSGCHDLPPDMQSNSNSLDTGDTNNCIRAFTSTECRRRFKEFSGLYPDLDDWNDKIKSWETCSRRNRAEAANYTDNRISFYFSTSFNGKDHETRSSPGCHELPRIFRGDTQSLDTGGNCIRVFALGECKGSHKEFSEDREDLHHWNDRIRSWEMCDSPIRNETAEERNSRVTFFYKNDFRGREHTEPYISSGCHELPNDMSADSQSLDAGDNCIRVFKEMDCTGVSKEFTGGHVNLEAWKDKIRSWEGCIASPNNSTRNTSENGIISFFVLTNFRGSEYQVKHNSGCHQIPDLYNANSQSLRTHGKCIRVFSGDDCTEERHQFTGEYEDLDEWNDKISSWEPCSQFLQTDISTIRFYFLTDFTGTVHAGHTTSGCHELPRVFLSNTRSVQTNDNCVKVFSDIGCTGETQEFAGDRNDLEEWRDKIKSWKSCPPPL